MRILNDQEQATTGLVELIKRYPPDTLFFINSWTWGYEDILKAIARAFQCQVWSIPAHLIRSLADLV